MAGPCSADAGVSTDPAVGLAPLKVTVGVSLAAGFAGNASKLRLTGHSTGTADINGHINVSDLVVMAEPSQGYNLSASLTDFPSVCLSAPLCIFTSHIFLRLAIHQQHAQRVSQAAPVLVCLPLSFVFVMLICEQSALLL